MSSDGDGVGAVIAMLFAAGPLAGGAVYKGIQAKYRNRSARYMPEREVAREVTDMVVKDEFIARETVNNSTISGRNDTTPAVRAKFSKVTKT